MNFESYLQNKKLSAKTIKSYQKQVLKFIDWIEEENLQLKNLSYKDLLKHIAQLRQKGHKEKTISYKLGVIRHYLNYKVVNQEMEINPAQTLYLKDTVRRMPYNLLNDKEIESVYKNYQPKQKSHKIIFGLLAYQALTLGELEKLTPAYLKLSEGKIHVPGSRKSNSRWLALKAFQILELNDYLNDYLKTKEAEKPLFTSKKGSCKLGNTLAKIFKEIKEFEPKVKHALQIRASVIVNKLKTNGLREVQYFAGHKYVSSTEIYKLGNIENLKKQVEKYHPLRGS